MARREGGGQFKQQSVPNTLQVYVSAEGRTFERRSVPGGSHEGVGGGAITGRAGSSRFQGNTLVAAGATRGGGVRMVVVTFDAGFSGCTAKVQVGHEGGSSVVEGRSMRTGRPIEFTMLGVSGESCSIQSGNVFAQ